MYAPAIGRASLTERTILAGREVFLGRRRGPLALLPFAGPAVIASIAYMDPGNFATNIQAGAGYGYELLWVALSANLVAILFQALSAKIGIATGRSLAELCREHFAPPVVYTMWLASEIAAMATELAELLGASLGLTLLCGIPLLASMLLVGIATYAALHLQRSGFRPVEILIGCCVGVITASYLIEPVIAPPHWGGVAAGVLELGRAHHVGHVPPDQTPATDLATKAVPSLSGVTSSRSAAFRVCMERAASRWP